MRRIASLIWTFLAAGCTPSTTERLRLPPLETVAQVDLSRYVGTWYEIASFPQRFQRGCTATTATYTLREDGDVDVLNRCHKGSLDGEEKTARGRARVVDRATNAKLEVSFFRPFRGDYWIIDLANDYTFAVVGHPGRDYLWILARTPTMADSTYEGIVARLRARGYDTPVSCGPCSGPEAQRRSGESTRVDRRPRDRTLRRARAGRRVGWVVTGEKAAARLGSSDARWFSRPPASSSGADR